MGDTIAIEKTGEVVSMNNKKRTFLEWEKKKLKNLVNRDISYGVLKPGGDGVKKIPLVRINNITKSNIFINEDLMMISEKLSNQYKRTVLKGNELLFSVVGTVGRVMEVPVELAGANISRALAILDVNEEVISKKFLFYILQSPSVQKEFELEMQGNAQKVLNLGALRNLTILVPSKKEQQKIAEILSAADEQIEKTEQLIEKTSELKQGLIQQLFSKGINHSEFKETEIGKIPYEWKTCFVEEIATVKTGDKDTQNKITNGKFDFYVRSQKVEKIDTYSFEGEAILTAGDGVGVGKVFHYIPGGKFDFHQRVYKISNFKEVSGKFFFYYFSKNFIKQARKFNAKTSVDSVRREMITKMIIPLPPIHEQNEIADILSSVDEQIKAYEKEREMQIELKMALMQQLLTGKIRGTV